MNKKVILGTIIFTSIFGMHNICYAENISSEDIKVDTYKNLVQENSEEPTMPSSYSITVSEDILNRGINNVARKFKSNIGLIKSGVSANSSSYDLRSKISIDVKNQENTQECWAFSLLSSMESNSKLKNGTSKKFSTRHMNYATSNSFTDGKNELAFNRNASDGGSAIVGLAYLTNGQGAVLEEEMPFKSDMNKISIKDIKINPSYYVKGYEALPTICKDIKDGKVVYSNGVDKYYSYEEVCNLRRIIKQHILDYGGITAYTAGNSLKSYSSKDIVSSKAYYCNDYNAKPDHAITIVGWDDNYSKDNFTGSSKPSRDGAYLVLNSYSDKVFDGGYIWISYEDVLIETILYGITVSEKISYDNLYQHDFYGANVPITVKSQGKELQEGYFANVYNRDASKPEVLNEVAVSSNQYARFDIYVNSKNGDTNINNMQKVASTDILNPGYNTISINPVLLTGSEFSIVIKQKAVNETFYFMLEAEVDNTFYSNTTANKGDSKISVNGTDWVDLADLGHIDYGGFDIDLSKADVCIKGFTTYKKVTSDNYKISQDNYITKIYDNTKIKDFLSKTTITDKNYQFIDKKGNVVNDYNSLVQTGMTLKVENENYKLVVRGDVNGDGKISLIDLSKQIAHYSEIKGFILKGEYEKACDINLDDNVSIIDVSQFLVLYNKM